MYEENGKLNFPTSKGMSVEKGEKEPRQREDIPTHINSKYNCNLQQSSDDDDEMTSIEYRRHFMQRDILTQYDRILLSSPPRLGLSMKYRPTFVQMLIHNTHSHRGEHI